MVKHIVLFKLNESLQPEEKAFFMNMFKEAIELLPEKIPCLKHVEVGFNKNPLETFDIALYSEFDKMEDVGIYSANPDHMAAAGIIKPYIVMRSCVDYEY